MNSYLIIALTLIFSAFFSGMEMAFISANKLRVELDKKQGLLTGRIVALFINNSAHYITTMLIGNNISLVIYGLIMASLLEPAIAIYIQNQPLKLIIQTILSTLLILITAEFLPKTLFRRISNTALNIFSFPLLIIFVVLFPITLFVNWLSDLVILALRGNDKDDNQGRPDFNKLDLSYFIHQSKEGIENEINYNEEGELKLFQNALDFSSVKVRDCMVPRNEIVAIDLFTSIDELRSRFLESGYSKIPVYKDDVDDIIGYITLKSLFDKPTSIKEIMHDIIYVPETMPANNLLQRFIRTKKSMAMVVDEFGGISGMLTIEDIIEEIFGEIEDEYDSTEFIDKQINENEYILSGRLELDYLNEKYNFHFPEDEDFDTLAGFVIHHHENIPESNEIITINNMVFKILKVSKTKIELLHLKLDT